MRYLISFLGAFVLISCGDSAPAVGEVCDEGGAVVCGGEDFALVCERPDPHSERMWAAVECPGGCVEGEEGEELVCGMEGMSPGDRCLNEEMEACASSPAIVRCIDGVAELWDDCAAMDFKCIVLHDTSDGEPMAACVEKDFTP